MLLSMEFFKCLYQSANREIWPLSLARAYPHWQVDGFDISKASSIPANVSLYEHNTFQPFPVEYHGKYDIVNVRFMITLLDKEKVRLLLQS
ncbi:hypothetical protein N7528_007064 [Penicillium herquei]|nr:hypothetical protein N7528_007064 [Penicillium herquei]